VARSEDRLFLYHTAEKYHTPVAHCMGTHNLLYPLVHSSLTEGGSAGIQKVAQVKGIECSPHQKSACCQSTIHCPTKGKKDL
jgi:hypothetical protein